MLWTIAVILLVMWALGMVSSYTLGGFIHILLIIAVAVILFLICFVLALAYQRWVLRRDTDGATTYG